MSVNLPYQETEAQRLTFEILEDSEDFFEEFEDIDVKDWDAVKEVLQQREELNLSGYNKISDLSIKCWSGWDRPVVESKQWCQLCCPSRTYIASIQIGV